MLTDAGLPIVDGVMVTANFAYDNDYSVFTNWYKYAPVWQAYLTGNSSNCVATSCPCLDGKTPLCTKEGDSLTLGNGLSWFREKLNDVSTKAHGPPLSASLLRSVSLYSSCSPTVCSSSMDKDRHELMHISRFQVKLPA